MKVIKLIYLLILMIFLSCSSDSGELNTFDNSDLSFVRFSVQLNNQELITQSPNNPDSPDEIESYSYPGSYVKLPVKLSTTDITENITVEFVIENTNLIQGQDYELTPSNKVLNFTENQPVDTITIRLNQRLTQQESMQLRLTNASDSNITLGYPREVIKLDTFQLTFEPTLLLYSFDRSFQSISGTKDELVDFQVVFNHGYWEDEIDPLQLFSGTSSFNYSYDNTGKFDRTINFQLTVEEDLPEEFNINELLNLLELNGYTKSTFDCLQINKPFNSERSGNPAENFYDSSNPFFRLRGDNWEYDSADMQCEWRNHNIFSVPVTITGIDNISENEADKWIFVSDNGTPNDISDDVYHHRFRIGFVSPNAPIGTNPFDLRGVFSGISVSSPGLNLTEAIEFFPENGDSETNGTISVVSQKVFLIKTSDDSSVGIPISGSGTYEVVDTATNLWKMEFTVDYDLTPIGVTTPYFRQFVLYNQAGQPNPEDLTEECFDTIDL